MDLEAAFVDRGQLMRWVEMALSAVVAEVLGQELTVPFPQVALASPEPVHDDAPVGAPHLGFRLVVGHACSSNTAVASARTTNRSTDGVHTPWLSRPPISRWSVNGVPR